MRSRLVAHAVSVCLCIAQAHARLCARSCVTLQDAVMAVLILDSSMTGSSLMGWSNALHTHFPDDPDAEYDMLERQVGRTLQGSGAGTAQRSVTAEAGRWPLRCRVL